MGNPLDTRRSIAAFIDTSTEYGRGLLQGISRYIRERAPHWQVFLEASSGENPANLERWRGDGILARPRSVEARAYIAKLPIPRVLMFPLIDAEPTDAAPCIEAVLPDRAIDTRLAVQHLIQSGLRDLTFVPTIVHPTIGRFSLAADAARDFGAHLEAYPIDRSSPRPSARQQLDRLAEFLKALPKPHGIVAANDWAGRDVIDAAQIAGIRIPDELAVIGSDNDSTFCNFCNPTLTSIAIDTETIGYRSARTLDALLQGEPPPQTPELIPPLGVVARQSTDALYIEDPRLRAAFTLIREKATDGITVEDVAQAAAMSRRSLENLFKKVVGTTPAKAIERTRVLHALRLLGGTNWKMDRIADACGYANAPRLYESFTRFTGTSPRKFRERTKQLANPEDAAHLIELKK